MNEKPDSETILNANISKAHLSSTSENDLKNTMPLDRKALLEDLKIQKRAQLEVFGLESEPICKELGKDEFIIGRSSECDLPIPVDDVSRNHARIFCNNEEFYIEDLGSTNGTYVNGITVVRCVLRSNDQIDIGDVKMIFVEVEMRNN